MTLRTCPACGAAEVRVVNAIGALISTNLDPFTGKCTACLVKASVADHTFHSRRADRKGEVVDTKALAARNDE